MVQIELDPLRSRRIALHLEFMADASSQQSATLDELVSRPLSDIAREISALRQENVRLKHDVERLNREIESLAPVSSPPAPLGIVFV